MFRDLFYPIPYLKIRWYNIGMTPLQLLLDWGIILNSYDRSTGTESNDHHLVELRWFESNDGQNIYAGIKFVALVNQPLIPTWGQLRQDYTNYTEAPGRPSPNW
ncbi:MAG: hypothetical protein ACFBSC_08205 [Microcoleaceae cyanobacterium]